MANEKTKDGLQAALDEALQGRDEAQVTTLNLRRELANALRTVATLRKDRSAAMRLVEVYTTQHRSAYLIGIEGARDL